MKYAIETRNLTKIFPLSKNIFERISQPKSIKALYNINIKIKKGEFIALVGPNASGKTTLLKLLATIYIPTKGEIFINSLNSSKHSLSIRKTIGFISSDKRSLYWRLSGRDNMIFFAHLYGVNSKKINAKMSELSFMLKIDKLLDYPVYTYSDGMKQKLIVMRSLIYGPDILLLDEPTDSLDAEIRKELTSFIFDILVRKENKTIVWASHHSGEFVGNCDKVLNIYEGEILGQI